MLGEIVVSAIAAIFASFTFHIFYVRRMMRVAVQELAKELEEELDETED